MDRDAAPFSLPIGAMERTAHDSTGGSGKREQPLAARSAPPEATAKLARSARVLVCECDPRRPRPVSDEVRDLGYEVVALHTLADSLREATVTPFDVIVASVPTLTNEKLSLLQLLRRATPTRAARDRHLGRLARDARALPADAAVLLRRPPAGRRRAARRAARRARPGAPRAADPEGAAAANPRRGAPASRPRPDSAIVPRMTDRRTRRLREAARRLPPPARPRRLPVGPRADARDHDALPHRGGRRERRGDRLGRRRPRGRGAGRPRLPGDLLPRTARRAPRHRRRGGARPRGREAHPPPPARLRRRAWSPTASAPTSSGRRSRRPRRARRAASRRCSASSRKGLPALVAAYRLQEKAAAVGFDWPTLEGPLAKVREETGRGRAGARRNRRRREPRDRARDRRPAVRGGQPGAQAAHRPRARAARDVAPLPRPLRAHRDGGSPRAARTPAQSNLEEMDALWEEAKRLARSAPAAPPAQGDQP